MAVLFGMHGLLAAYYPPASWNTTPCVPARISYEVAGPLASDGTFLYWTRLSAMKEFVRMPAVGGTAETLFSSVDETPSTFTLDGNLLYWIDGVGPPMSRRG